MTLLLLSTYGILYQYIMPLTHSARALYTCKSEVHMLQTSGHVWIIFSE